ncbi:MAG: hypothetical protein DWI24_03645 [Planctomycetota bacterium]|nr:MAG: hypothetical protein DWI24_03645 [Planctomycetota bacterium]
MVERSDTTGYEMGVKAAGTPAGVQGLMSRLRPVVLSLTLLNHRLLAPDACGIVAIKKCHSWPRRAYNKISKPHPKARNLFQAFAKDHPRFDDRL